MLYDPSFFDEFIKQDQIKTYELLFRYLKNISEDIYNQFEIYTEEHHYVPTHETKENTEIIKIPIPLHFRLHLLRAKEYEGPGNYYKAYRIYKKWKRYCYFNEYEVLRCKVNLNKKAQSGYTYEQKYGRVGALIRKKKISDQMRNIDKEIIKKRNQSISEQRKKPVIEINTNKVFSCIQEAALSSTYSASWIRLCCNNKTKEKLYKYKEF